ncbi:MAG: sodium-dependent bicarbonate transport family permease [Pseudomonadales bacterium]|nr:sodium-dependent bicarbonate transport family permease [Pseudomonadales bacterium]
MFDVVICFFLLGIFARLVNSDLKLPDQLYQTLSIYLLLAIGLKGGLELSKQPLLALLPEVLALMALGFIIPFLLYPFFRALKLSAVDSSALGAHFGSVSVVTFAIVMAQLAANNIDVESHAPLWVAVLEAPGLIAGVLLAKMMTKQHQSNTAPVSWRVLLHDVLFGKSVLLLVGGLLIGAIAGEKGIAPIKMVFIDPFKGLLAFFLMELGLIVGSKLKEKDALHWPVLVIGFAVPPVLAVLGAGVGMMLGLSVGGVAVVATLAASASYIAAPTAMRIAVPEANPALSISVALAVVFPFNVVVGIPLYIHLAQWLTA